MTKREDEKAAGQSKRTELRKRRIAFQAMIVCLALSVSYFLWVIKSEAPIIVHCFFLGGMLISFLEIVGWLWQRGAVPRPVKPREDSGDQRMQVTKRINDEVLGVVELVETEDDYFWRATLSRSEAELAIQMAGGKEVPAPAALSDARALAIRFDDLLANVEMFLNAEADRSNRDRDEILELSVETIAFFWPERVGYGEITFAELQEGRLWTCGYDQGRLFNLSVSGG